jgi:carbon-monoxide dehydrogenase small subunit
VRVVERPRGAVEIADADQKVVDLHEPARLRRRSLPRMVKDAQVVDGTGLVRVELRVNGEETGLTVEPRTLLVNALRDELALTGTKIGCDTSQCGACTVLVDGRAFKSCTLLAVRLDGTDVTTIEGLADGRSLHPIQEAFAEHHGLQCGFCTPGMILATADLLDRDPDPEDEAIRRALAGNLCRCTGYQGILASVRAAADAVRVA